MEGALQSDIEEVEVMDEGNKTEVMDTCFYAEA